MSDTGSLLELTLFVADVDRSAQFYRALGVTLLPSAESAAVRHFDGTLADTAVQLWPAGDHPLSRVQLGLRVPAVPAVVAQLNELGIGYISPGPRRLVTRDPDGNNVHVVETAGYGRR